MTVIDNKTPQKSVNGFLVQKSGIHTLLQDEGRFGFHHLGLTNGGPVDPIAFKLANKLCGNALDASALEITFGGLQLLVQGNSQIALTGANMTLTINDAIRLPWQSHDVFFGDVIKLGMASEGIRGYLAVSGGFTIAKQFGSSATVCREKIGGLSGEALKTDDFLPCQQYSSDQIKKMHNFLIDEKQQPHYQQVNKANITLRTIPSYQQKHFSSIVQRMFYSSEYVVSHLCDRMGYRLNGQQVSADIEGILSEGICHGAIQIPADGQPIVLLNDRQTIGGYPKIGAVIALDTAKLAQVSQGAAVRFEPISMEAAHNINHLALKQFESILLHRIT
jgi:biotin-dependent carboxylase-like uncharacterized protein